MGIKVNAFIAVLMVSGMIMFGNATNASAGEVLVIANPSVPAESLDSDSIKNIFLGDTAKWRNNDMITIVVSEKVAVHKEFLKKYVKRTENQFRNVWRQNLFSGKGKQPIRVKSLEELVEYVSKTKGAIGYISSDLELPADVKVIAK